MRENQVLGILIIKFMKKVMIEEQIIERVKLLTGKTIELTIQDFGKKIITIDGNSFILETRTWVEYKQLMETYCIDIISDFSNVIIREFNLKING